MTLPNFIIIGAYKSGTTSLYHYLRQHPQVFMSPIKEPNFFSLAKKKELMRARGGEREVIDSIEAYTNLFAEVGRETAIGEASPIYLSDLGAAHRIKETLPNVKLIAILRQPAEAFYSDHNMRVRDRRRLESDFLGRFETLANRVKSGEVAGPMYFQQLKSYFDQFDRSNLKVYLYEELKSDAVVLMKDIFMFLGVDPHFVPNTTEKHNVGSIPRSSLLDKLHTAVVHKRRLKRVPLLSRTARTIQRLNTAPTRPLRPELRKQFTEIFRSDISNLEKLIDKDLSGWLR